MNFKTYVFIITCIQAISCTAAEEKKSKVLVGSYIFGSGYIYAYVDPAQQNEVKKMVENFRGKEKNCEEVGLIAKVFSDGSREHSILSSEEYVRSGLCSSKRFELATAIYNGKQFEKYKPHGLYHAYRKL